MPVNGGLWLVHATPRGKNLLQAWLAVMYNEYVVDGRMWNGTATLDQVRFLVFCSTNTHICFCMS